MEFLGIGPLELLFIIIIIIVVMGPKDIQRTMRGLGRGLNALYKSDSWKTLNEVTRELRGLPSRLVREAELEELEKTSQEITQAIASTTPDLAAWTTPAEAKQTIARPGAALAPQAEPVREPDSSSEPNAPADPQAPNGRDGAARIPPA